MKSIVWVVAVIAVLAIVVGCGDDGGSPGDGSRPMVTQTNPANGAEGVSLNTSIWIAFSEAMDAASLDSISVEGVTLRSIDYDEGTHAVILWLDEVLAGDTEHRVRVAAAVRDEAGNKMGADYTFTFTTGPFSCDYLEDHFESNDDIASATPVDLDHWYWLIPSCGGASRSDYYRFTVTDTTKTTVRTKAVFGDTTRIEWQLHFYREDGKAYGTLGTSPVIPAEFSYRYSFLPGTYYVLIGKAYDDQHTGVYNFIIETSDPCQDDEYEDNDFRDEAKPIAAGLHDGLRGCHVDADYFTIELMVGQTIKVTMTEVTANGGTRRLGVSGPGGGRWTTDSIEPAMVEWVAVESSTFYIETRWWTDGVIYDLNVEVLD